MRRLLLVSYHYPPLGGAGVQRPLRLTQYLPERDWEPVVLTGSAEQRGRWTPLDQTLAAEVPPATRVRRLGGEPGPPSRARGIAERWLTVPSAWERWWIDGVLAAGRDAGRDVDVIYAWMQPYATAAAAAGLAAALGRPWIADLGDPWALDEQWMYVSALHRRRDRFRMRRLLGTAAAIVMSTPEAAARVRHAFPELADRPIVAIPNGYEPRDFAGPPPQRADDAFRIVHTGYLHADLGLRQHRLRRLRLLAQAERSPGVDMLARSHVYLLRALGSLAPELAARVELHLAGVLSPEDERIAARSPLVTLHGYLPHAEAVALMRSADLLFLPMHDLPAGQRASIVPGKTYEYLASGRPILAAVSEGDARDLLLEAGTAHVVAPADADAMADVIGKLATSPKTASQAPEQLLRRYEYRNLVQEVAALLDQVACE